MTERRKATRVQVERLLAQAHAMREGVAVGEDWVHGVMRVVRQDAAAHPYASMLAWAEPLVWRVAAVAEAEGEMVTRFEASICQLHDRLASDWTL